CIGQRAGLKVLRSMQDRKVQVSNDYRAGFVTSVARAIAVSLCERVDESFGAAVRMTVDDQDSLAQDDDPRAHFKSRAHSAVDVRLAHPGRCVWARGRPPAASG